MPRAFCWDAVLGLIDGHPAGLTTQQIAALTGWDRNDVKLMTYLLAKYGYIGRIPSAAKRGQPIVYVPLDPGPAG